MAYSEFNYSLSSVARERLEREQALTEPARQEKTPNRKSLAKKAWWAEKRAEQRRKLSEEGK